MNWIGTGKKLKIYQLVYNEFKNFYKLGEKASKRKSIKYIMKYKRKE